MDVRDVLVALLVFLLVFAALCFLSQLLAAFLRDLWRQAKQEAEAAFTAAAKPAATSASMPLKPAPLGSMVFTADYIRCDEFVLPRRRVVILGLDPDSFVLTAFLDNNIQLRIGLGNAKQAKAFMKAFTGERPSACPHGTRAAGVAEAAAADDAAASP